MTAAHLVSAHLGLAATVAPSGGGAHVFVTEDMLGWRDVTPAGLTGSVDDLAALDQTRWWATTSGCAAGSGTVTVWRTVDAGAHWSSAPAGGHPCAAGSVSLITFLDATHGWLVDLMPTGPVADLWATADGGRTWAKRSDRLPELGTIAFRDPENGFLGGAGLAGTCGTALYATHDGGTSWRAVGIDVGGALVSSHALYGTPTFFDARDGVLPVSFARADTEMVAWYSTGDGGTTWVLRSSARVVGTIEDHGSGCAEAALTSAVSPTTWWAAAKYREDWATHVTTDGGRSWTDRAATPAWSQPSLLQAVDAETGWWEAGNRALLATADGGGSAGFLNPQPPQSAAP